MTIGGKAFFMMNRELMNEKYPVYRGPWFLILDKAEYIHPNGIKYRERTYDQSE
jgi:hypothetical protein